MFQAKARTIIIKNRNKNCGDKSKLQFTRPKKGVARAVKKNRYKKRNGTYCRTGIDRLDKPTLSTTVETPTHNAAINGAIMSAPPRTLNPQNRAEETVAHMA